MAGANQDPATPITAAVSPLPMEAKRALRPTRSLNAARSTSARLMEAIPGPISELASPCRTRGVGAR
jgi:hypothetical protein